MSCITCPLLGGIKVFGCGPVPAKIMFIGEAPGAEEEAAGVPFVGQAGKLLNEVMQEIGLDPAEVYITNVSKCRPPHVPKQQKPKKEVVNHCIDLLIEEIAAVNPEMIVLLGDAPLHTFFPKAALSREVGTVKELEGRKFVVCFHPASALPSRNPKHRRDIEMVLRGLLPRKDSSTVKVMLTKEVFPGDLVIDKTIGIDSEWENGKLFCTKTTGEVTPESTLIAHNIKSDGHFLPWVFEHPYEDTMLRAHLLGKALKLKELSFGLLHRPLSSIPEILGTGKKAKTMEQMRPEVEAYCYEDARAARDLLPLLPLNEKEEWVYRNIDLPLVPWLVEIEKTGVPVDKEFLENYRAQRLASICDVDFGINLNSPAQVAELLFEQWGLTGSAVTSTGARSTGEAVLAELAKEDSRVAALMCYRGVWKEISTYVDPWLESDGWIHPEYNQCGTGPGRLSSSNPNGQNIAKSRLREAIRAPEGWVLLEWDADQLEMRIMAGLSGDKKMLGGYNAKPPIDFHTITQSELVLIRRDAKIANFAVAYGGGVGILMEKLGLSYEAAKAFHRKYFRVFAGLGQYFDEQEKVALKTGAVYNEFGRPVRIPELFSTNKSVRSHALRQALNAPIQGTGGDLTKLVMIDCLPELKKEGVRPCGQVHDSILALAPIKLAQERLEAWSDLLNSSISSHFQKCPVFVKPSVYQRWDHICDLSLL